MMITTVVLYSGITLAAVIWAALDGRWNVFVLRGWEPARGALGACAGVGVGLCVVALSRGSVRVFGWARRLHEEFHSLMRGLTDGQAFVLAAASAIGEEALFRGAMVPTLGIWLSSALFALAHAPVRRALWPWPLMAFAMGLAFAWLFQRFGDLSGPILAHGVINFLNLRHIARFSFSEELPLPLAEDHSPGEDLPEG
ncbi:MAG: CPBP family intramembrane glutamic endopeptidase [bacterium]